MGNSCNEKDKLIELSLQTYGYADHPDFGPVTILKNKVSPYYFIMKAVDFRFPVSQLSRLALLKDHNCDYLLKLHAFRREDTYCSQSAEGVVMATYWDYFNYTLNDLALNRCAKNKYFLQEDICHLLKALTQALLFTSLHEITLPISLHGVYLTPEGFAKVLIPPESPQQVDFRSPQSFQAKKYNQQKSDIFRIGLLLLFLISHRLGPTSLSKFTQRTMLPSRRIFKFDAILQMINPRLITTVHAMLNPSPFKRPLIRELVQGSREWLQQWGVCVILKGGQEESELTTEQFNEMPKQVKQRDNFYMRKVLQSK